MGNGAVGAMLQEWLVGLAAAKRQAGSAPGAILASPTVDMALRKGHDHASFCLAAMRAPSMSSLALPQARCAQAGRCVANAGPALLSRRALQRLKNDDL